MGIGPESIRKILAGYREHITALEGEEPYASHEFFRSKKN
jgi:hypothetical protein